MAGPTGLYFFDSSLRQTSNIPISRTPLGILLSEKATLSGDVTVTGIERLPGQIDVSLIRTASPGDGSLTLTFAGAGAVTVMVVVEGAGAMDHSMPDPSAHDQHMADPAYKAMHDEHMKDPAHKAMHDQMHGAGK